MKQSSPGAFVALALGALFSVAALGGCLAPQDDGGPRLGSESHFLMACFSEDDCSSGLGCICGVCTASCDTALQCSAVRLGETSAGFATECSSETGIGTSAICSPFSAPPNICVASCTVDDECGDDASQFVCDRGRCRDRDLPSNDRDAEAPDAIDESDASDDGSADATPDVVVDVDDLELVECVGDLVSTREQLDALADCQRVTSDLTVRDMEVTSADFDALVDVQGAFRVLNVNTSDAELRMDALRRVTGDFAVQNVDGAGRVIAAPLLASVSSFDVSGITTNELDFSALAEVTDALVLASSDVDALLLPSLAAVGEGVSLRTIGGLQTFSAPRLTSVDTLSLDGLAALTSVDLVRLSGTVSELDLVGLTSLLTLDLGDVNVIDGLRVQRMNTWTDLSALASVQGVSGMTSVVISENALLRSTDGLMAPSALDAGALLNVERNPRLTDITALTEIGIIGASARISVSANARLPQCAVAAWLIAASTEVTAATIDAVASGNDELATCE